MTKSWIDYFWKKFFVDILLNKIRGRTMYNEVSIFYSTKAKVANC